MFDEANDAIADQQVAEMAAALVRHFGREAPLRAELAARNALTSGDKAAYRLYKRAESAAEEILFERQID